MRIRQPDDFGGDDLGPIEGGKGWVLACVYTLGALLLAAGACGLIGWMLPLLASVIGP